MRGQVELARCIAVAALASLTFVAACTAKTPPVEPQSPYVIASADMQVERSSATVYWLNDATILFVGGEAKPGFVALTPEVTGLYLWALGRKPERYRADIWPPKNVRIGMSYVCAHGGEVALATGGYRDELRSAVDTVPILRGPLGREKGAERRITLNEMGGDSRPIGTGLSGDTNVTERKCDDYRDATMLGRRWAVDYTRQYYLDFGPTDSAYVQTSGPATRLLTARGELIQALPFREKEEGPFRPFCAETPPWRPGFTVWRCGQGWDDPSRAQPYVEIFEVGLDGRVETRRVKNGPEIWGGEITPFRHGYLVTNTGAAAGAASQSGGLYFVQPDGGLKRLMPGLLSIAAVSPDGCKAAVYDLKRTQSQFHLLANLIVIDVCNASER